MKNIPEGKFLILGRANAGKTLFMLNFAEYMGYKDLKITFKGWDQEMCKNNEIEDYKKSLVSEVPNTTRCLQSAIVDVPVLKGKKPVEFIDTTGLSSSIHFEQEVREAMAQTLALLKEKYTILHILDAACISKEKKIDDIDMELYRFGLKRGGYLVLANKMDIENALQGFEIIKNNMPDTKIIKISALCKIGFNEVKKYVSKLA